MSLYFALQTVENNKNKKSVKFQGDMLNFCDFIQVFIFTRNHHLKIHKAPITTAADNIHKIFFYCFSEKIRLDVSNESYARQRIHMKNQTLFSSKDKSKKFKMWSAAIFVWLNSSLTLFKAP